MEIINPDGTKAEVKPAEEKEEVPAFRADFNSPGWMKLEVNIEAVSHSRQAQWQLMGFMEDHKNIAMGIIARIVAQREAVKTQITKASNGNMFKRFLNGKR